MAQLQTTAVTGSLTVTGQIIAQTLNVQQVTSSIVYSSGSNRFGNLVTDVQQFTGSLRVTGSGAHYIVGGSVGIGTSNPNTQLYVSSPAVISIPALGSPSSHLAIGNLSSYGTMIGTLGTGVGYIQQQRFDGTATGYNLLLQPNAGNVGIATTTPGTLLHVHTSTAAVDVIRITNGTQNLNLGVNNSAGGSYIWETSNQALRFGTNNIERGRFASTGTFLVGDTIAPSVSWSGTAVFGKTATNKVIIGYLASSTNGAVIGGHNSALSAWADLNINASTIIFRSSEVERMRMASTGNVGIGTTAPTALLHIYGTGATRGLKINATTATEYAEVQLAASAREYRIGVGGASTIAPNQFYIYDATPQLVRVTLNTDGNVGIGTTSPAARLQVSGSSNVLNIKGSGSLSTSSLFSVDGAFGRLFEVTDDLSNSLFSVNTIAGLPVIEAFADYSVNLGTYSAASGSTMRITGSSVGIGTTNPAMNLQIDSTGFSFRLRETSNGSSLVLSGNQIQARTSANAGSDLYLNFTNGGNILMAGSGTNLGIGTTAPGGKLDLAFTSAQGATAFILRTTDSSAGNGTIRWRDSANNNEAAIGSSFNVGDPGALEFINGTTTNMILRSTGNLGLGLTAPDARLTVSASSGDLATFYTGTNKRLTITTGGELSFNTSFSSGLLWSPASLRFEGQTLGITARPFASNYVSFTVAGATGQTANLQTWQAQNGTVYSVVDSLGDFAIQATASIGKLQIGSNWTASPGGGNQVYLSSTGFANSAIIPEVIITSNNASTTPGGVIGLALHNANVTAGAFAPLLVFSKTETGSSPYNASIAAIGARTVTGTGAGNAWIDGDLMFYTAPTAGSGLVERMRIIQDGNIGIGTTVPNYKLHVFGGPIVAGATNTQLALLGADGSNVAYVGSLTNHAFQIRTNNTTRATVDTNGNVGIGTTVPGSRLDVVQNGSAAGITVRDGTNPQIRSTDGTLTAKLQIIPASLVGYVGTETNHPFAILSNNTTRIHVEAAGNVGIGTTVPGDKLEVVGNVYSNAFNSVGTLSRYASNGGIAMAGLGGSAYAYIIAYSNSSGTPKNLGLQIIGGNVGIGTISPINTLQVIGGITALSLTGSLLGTASYATQALSASWAPGGGGSQWVTTGNDIYYTTGNVGIGTTSPTYKLHVSGGNSFFNGIIAGFDTTYGEPYRVVGFNSTADGGNRILASSTTSDGMYFMAATGRGFNFRANGGTTNHVTITSAGNVGIGTAIPSYKLDVSGSIRTQQGYIIGANANADITLDGNTGSRIRYSGQSVTLDSTVAYISTNSAIRLYVTNGGSVGIGTTSPGYILDVAGQMRIQGNTIGGPLLVNGGDSSTGFSRASIALGFSGTDGYYHWIHTRHNGGSSVNNAIDFYTSDGTQNGVFPTNGVLGMTITAGNVGIGTTTPAYKLHVVGNAYVSTTLTIGSTTNIASTAWLQFNSADVLLGEGTNTFLQANGAGAIYFRNNTPSTLMTILNGGSVGIGTTSPAYKLEVVGTGRISGNTVVGPGTTAIGGLSLLTGGASPINNRITYGTDGTGWKFAIGKNQGGTITDQFTIQDDGNIGIGTTAVTARLHVQGTTVISGSLGLSGSAVGLPEHMIIALSDETTNITTGTNKVIMRAPFAMRLTDRPRASLSTASTSGLVTVDINENGTSVLGANKLSIDANELTSVTAATQTTIADPLIADDAQIRFDIDGAGTGARGLKVTLYYIRV